MLNFSSACVAQSTASCCISSPMSAFLMTAFRSDIVPRCLFVMNVTLSNYLQAKDQLQNKVVNGWVSCHGDERQAQGNEKKRERETGTVTAGGREKKRAKRMKRMEKWSACLIKQCTGHVRNNNNTDVRSSLAHSIFGYCIYIFI